MTQDEKRISVSRIIASSAPAIFEVLTNPANHAAVDGSAMVRSDSTTDRITAVGQTFVMNMFSEHLGGDYQTENKVVGFDSNKLLSWTTAGIGRTPLGHAWTWELDPDSPQSTRVTLTCDWSGVSNPKILAKVHFPLVSEQAMEASLANLAALVDS